MRGKIKKWLIGIGVAAAAVLLFIVAIEAVFNIRGKTLLTKKIAELKAQGIPTNFAELEAKYKLPEGSPNAADNYLKAFAAYKPLPDQTKKLLPVIGEQPEPKDNEPYPPEQIAAAGEFIELNQEMFTLLHQAGEVESCCYPMNYSQDLHLIINLLRDIKQASHFLAVAGIYYTQTGRQQKAYEAVMDQLRLGRSLQNNPTMMTHLFRLAILGMGGICVQDFISRTTPDDAQLRQLQDCLQQVSQSTTIGPVIAGEICVCLEYRKLNRDVRNTNELMFYATALTPKDLAALIDSYQRIIEIDKLPIEEQFLRIEKICDVPLLFSPFRAALPAVEKSCNLHLRIRANIDCAITALAVERYRRKESKLPETLDVLVPEYLPQVYLDPFDGKPLRYKQTEPGYIIYTIGEDGVDDGGLGPVKGRTYDWAFHVYR